MLLITEDEPLRVRERALDTPPPSIAELVLTVESSTMAEPTFCIPPPSPLISLPSAELPFTVECTSVIVPWSLEIPPPPSVVDAAELEAHCRLHLGKQKRPRQIEVVAELPKNFLGKVLRRKLRETPAVSADGQGQSV